MTKKILPTITTQSDWRDKIREIDNLLLKEVCFFPTTLSKKERKEAYGLLKKTSLEKIPFVHLRTDMELWELDWFRKEYQTKVFNTHGPPEYQISEEWKKYKDIISIENTFPVLSEETVRQWGGVCIDLSHLENDRRQRPEVYQRNKEIIDQYKILNNHISAIKSKPFLEKTTKDWRYDDHVLEDLSELNYLKKYPARYFAPWIAIELENSLKEQLKVKEYLIKLLADKLS